MSRKLGVLLVLPVSLVVLGASASAGGDREPSWGMSGDLQARKNGVTYVNYYVRGDASVNEMRLYFTGFEQANKPNQPSRYLKLLPSSTTKYLKLKDGTIYWVIRNPPRRMQRMPQVRIAVRVRSDTPLQLRQCAMTYIKVFAPATATQPEYRGGAPEAGFCVGGLQWLGR